MRKSKRKRAADRLGASSLAASIVQASVTGEQAMGSRDIHPIEGVPNARQTTAPSPSTPSVPAAEIKASTETAAALHAEPLAIAESGARADMSVCCRDCKAGFTFSISEQELFLEKGWPIPRQRCEACTLRRKISKAGKNKPGKQERAAAAAAASSAL